MAGTSRIDDVESVGNYGEGWCCVCNIFLIDGSQPFSAGLMSSGAPFGISFGGALFMSGFGFFAVSAVVSRRIAMSQAVMPISSVGRFCTIFHVHDALPICLKAQLLET